MWTKTLTVNFQKKPVAVQVCLSDSEHTGFEVVTIQAMINEYFLIEEIFFPNRESAYSFIKNYPKKMAIDFLWRVGIDTGAIYEQISLK